MHTCIGVGFETRSADDQVHLDNFGSRPQFLCALRPHVGADNLLVVEQNPTRPLASLAVCNVVTAVDRRALVRDESS